ncbi:MAG: ribose-phosphate diphosphokinase [Pseudomonadales bacterium]|nr:ribose-phosphate diphosphokinase [Pseudomonadales bacterium]
MNRQVESINKQPIIFSLQDHPLVTSLFVALDAEIGAIATREFPDGESYLRVVSQVKNRRCVVICDLSHPNQKYLPLIFLLETMRELGAANVGLIAPYLSYMRQDRRFVEGEAITSKIFAADISRHIDWLVTVDPHLHRYHSLDEIYSVPSRVVQGAPALAEWLKTRTNLLLVGPDAESEQWVSGIAGYSGHPFVIGAKQRLGDRRVEVTLPDISEYSSHTAVIIDDVISSGQTILQCIETLKKAGIHSIQCVAVHGIFADGVDADLMSAGLESLVTSNTIGHRSNAIDIAPLLIDPINSCLNSQDK